ncbi:hypothetical protein J6590_061150 [Homalodisca vitripennis]|nr:hypothetical protein J6590_061150 [Homalodisca vitripennis]
MSKTDSKLNECRKCSKNVRHGGIFCKGVCQAWIHLRCINLSYSTVKTLTHNELEVWKCDDCLGKTGIKTLNLDNEKVNPELEYSLSLENEIDNAILHENEDLKQEEKEEEIEQLKANYDKKENEMLSKIKLLETRLKNENYNMQTLILQAEQDKENLIKELDKHKTWCKSCQIYKNEICNMMDSIRSLEAASEVLQKDNELLQDQIKTNKTLNCLTCFPSSQKVRVKATELKAKNPLLHNNTGLTKAIDTRKNGKKKSVSLYKNNVQPCSSNFETENRYSCLTLENDIDTISDNNSCEVVIERNSRTRRMLVCSDSHGKNLSWHINNNSKTFDAFSFVKPGGRANQVLNQDNIDGEKLGHSDLLVLACGSNDVSHNEASSAINAIKSTLKKNINKRIILVDLPNRFDLSDWSCVNVEIRKTNEELKRLSEQLGNVSLVQASKADRSLHTRHGMHLSLRGKQWLTSKILKAAVVMTTEQPPPPGCHQEEQSTSVEIIPGSLQASPSTKSWSGNCPLKVQHSVT